MKRFWVVCVILLLGACGAPAEAPGGVWEPSALRPDALACPTSCAGTTGPLMPEAQAGRAGCYVEREWSPGSRSFVWREVCEEGLAGDLTVTTRWGTSHSITEAVNAFAGGCQTQVVRWGGTREELPVSCDVTWSRVE